MRVLFIFGTRPEAIKLAPVIKEFQKQLDYFEIKICVTAQHREMLDQVLEVFKITPDYDLNIMEENQTLFATSIRVLQKLQLLLKKIKPDLIFVQGDTTTAFISALSGFYLKIPIAHVEAGLRTYDKYAPFPEEINRRLITQLADYHFAPTKIAYKALVKEGIAPSRILITGNTVIDALLLALKLNPHYNHPILKKTLKTSKIILVTAHRRESFGKPFENICQALKTIAENHKNVEIIYPVHPNPNIRKPAYKFLNGIDRIHLIPPQDYLSFATLMKASYIILTDSGGIQEEAPALKKPVLILREKTERPEAIAAGTAKLVGTIPEEIVKATNLLLHSQRAYQKMAKARNPFGDGKASKRIVNYFVKLIDKRTF
ncbi:MAG: UDP-N-acetylglucosamine 2-epimerase (non-hydrolyzing) [candidate division WOR-3 bacterium]|nr:UDP-N-acetylglucosamine 2-epimerase (non-hydrolyzing) [candidate division WOR-3 bacterium]